VALLLKPDGPHGDLFLPWWTLILTTLALAGYLILGGAPEAWVFDRAAIDQGQLWRMVTSHWVHSDLEHALWDIGALALLGTLFERRLRWRLPLALIVATLGVDAWLWGSSELLYYCGLSGITNSLLAIGLVQLWRDSRHPSVWLTGLGAVAKILLEISSGGALLTETAWPSVPEVHAVGFMCGLALGVVSLPKPVKGRYTKERSKNDLSKRKTGKNRLSEAEI
jgi:rhomboid family GlyGly-CTERM serine protease